MKEGKQEKYLKYVIQELVNNTYVDVRDQKIWHPYDEHYSRHLIGGAPLQFFDFVHESYGIFPEEVQSLWSQYKDRIRKENGWVQIYPFDSRGEAVRFAMSESRKHNKGNHDFKRIDNPKQHKFYNSIGDKVVSLIEVREYTGDGYDGMVEEIFLTDLLNPQYPRQGMSLPPNINIPDYETFQKRMLTIVQDFFPMLEHYWSIDDIFSQIFILTRFVFPKIWNKFYKGEDQAEESTDYGEHALDYEEEMGKEKINESTSLIDAVVKDMVKNTTTEVSEFSTRTVYVPTNNAIYNFDLLHNLEGCPNYLYNYIQDTYGLTTEEIEEVWVIYKDAIMNMLEDTDSNNPFAVTEEKHTPSYYFYEKVADDMLKKMDVFEPEADLEDEGLWYFVIDRIKTHDDVIFLSFEVTLKELEKARKSHQPLVELTKQIVQQFLPDYFKWFEHKFGYFNLEDIIQILSRFFIPKLYNKYLKEENAADAPIVLREHKSTNKLIDKMYNEIGDSLILTDETIELHFPYFKDTKGQPQIYYDPFHSNLGKFDFNYVLGELKRFVAYHLFKTMGIGKKLQYGNYDLMVDPIARKLIKDLYQEAVEKGIVNVGDINESKIRKTEDREYHRNGFINRVVKDILKRVELTLNEIVFDVVRDYGLTIDKPKIIYQYGEQGLSRDSVTVIRDAVPSMVHWYLSKHDISSGGEDPTVDIIASILSDIIIEKIVEFQEDEDWDDYKETWVLGESKKITFMDKVTQRVIDTIEEDEYHYYFKEISRPSYDTFKGEYGNKFSPLSVKKNGLNNELRSDWLYKKLKDFYGEMYGLRDDEMMDLYINILYHILKERNLNSLNPIIIGDWDLEHSPSLQINKEWEQYLNKDYNLRNLEDYIAMINFMGYDKVGDDVELFNFDRDNKLSYDDKYTEGWTKEDFKPYHQDLVDYLVNWHGQKIYMGKNSK